MTVTTDKLSDETAHKLAQDVQRWCADRWCVMWEPYRRVFTAYPAYDHALHTPIETNSAREVWRRILDVDHVLLQTVAEAIPAHPPKIVHVPPGFLQEVLG
ncbi:hypothetical protein SAMN05421505_13815 [Sinosporangium album]|uniref:Uncharacterized protein n=1 Tax=Sinosporangium album TaxID=504805 RepID=A0A1G8INA5_9ACTN|nr:hypothetical protein [Sinosporangium album]SDI20271.1 hypothetical protein SAMN05421505_13815 [Sinosporangium album]